VSARADGVVVAPPDAVGAGTVTVRDSADGVAVASADGRTAMRIAACRAFDVSAVNAPASSDAALS
jgi:hypothetical protein